MNAVEIEQAISEPAFQPFDAAEFPFAFLAAFGNKDTTLKRLEGVKIMRLNSGKDTAKKLPETPYLLGEIRQRGDELVIVIPRHSSESREYLPFVLGNRGDFVADSASALYDPDTMPDNLRHAHERNDEVLERIYSGRRFRSDTERLEKLFEQYTKMTAGIATKTKNGQKGKKHE